MPVNMSGATFKFEGQAPGPRFSVGGTKTEGFKITAKVAFLMGMHVGESKEPVFNGRLFLSSGHHAGTVIDNFPKSPAPEGWTKHPSANGYELRQESSGELLFAFRVEGETCFVETNLYDEDGTLVASADPETFVLIKGQLDVVELPFPLARAE